MDMKLEKILTLISKLYPDLLQNFSKHNFIQFLSRLIRKLPHFIQAL